jgi:plastocyanin
VLAVAAVSLILSGFAAFGCSKNPTNPYGGGNAGGMGNTGGTGGGGTSSGNTPFNSGTMNAPASFVRTFPVAGAVGYHCVFHVGMGMTGTVTVAAGASDSAVVTAGGTSFTPRAVSIRPGGYVHWKLTDGPHTVTSD